MEIDSANDADVMRRLIEEARAGASHDEITAKVREYYFPDDTDHDPIQGIRMRDKVSRDVAEWIFQMGIIVNHIQMKKDAAKERGTSQTD